MLSRQRSLAERHLTHENVSEFIAVALYRCRMRTLCECRRDADRNAIVRAARVVELNRVCVCVCVRVRVHLTTCGCAASKARIAEELPSGC